MTRYDYRNDYKHLSKSELAKQEEILLERLLSFIAANIDTTDTLKRLSYVRKLISNLS